LRRSRFASDLYAYFQVDGILGRSLVMTERMFVLTVLNVPAEIDDFFQDFGSIVL